MSCGIARFLLGFKFLNRVHHSYVQRMHVEVQVAIVTDVYRLRKDRPYLLRDETDLFRIARQPSWIIFLNYETERLSLP